MFDYDDDSVTKNLRDSANGTFVTLDDYLPPTDGGGSSETTARSSGRRGCADTAGVLETKSEREAWRRRYREVLPTS